VEPVAAYLDERADVKALLEALGDLRRSGARGFGRAVMRCAPDAASEAVPMSEPVDGTTKPPGSLPGALEVEARGIVPGLTGSATSCWCPIPAPWPRSVSFDTSGRAAPFSTFSMAIRIGRV
jgi:hypothetical protein